MDPGSRNLDQALKSEHAVNNESTNRLFTEIFKRCFHTVIRVILRSDEEVIEKPRPRIQTPYGLPQRIFPGTRYGSRRGGTDEPPFYGSVMEALTDQANLPNVQERPVCSFQQALREGAVQVLRCRHTPAEITQWRTSCC